MSKAGKWATYWQVHFIVNKYKLSTVRCPDAAHFIQVLPRGGVGAGSSENLEETASVLQVQRQSSHFSLEEGRA